MAHDGSITPRPAVASRGRPWRPPGTPRLPRQDPRRIELVFGGTLDVFALRRTGTVFAMWSEQERRMEVSRYGKRAAPKETQMLTENRDLTELPSCKCGTDRTRREATPEREYTFLGTLYALWGGTPIPSKVGFRCVHCGVAFDACSDLATRRAFIM